MNASAIESIFALKVIIYCCKPPQVGVRMRDDVDIFCRVVSLLLLVIWFVNVSKYVKVNCSCNFTQVLNVTLIQVHC